MLHGLCSLEKALEQAGELALVWDLLRKNPAHFLLRSGHSTNMNFVLVQSMGAHWFIMKPKCRQDKYQVCFQQWWVGYRAVLANSVPEMNESFSVQTFSPVV